MCGRTRANIIECMILYTRRSGCSVRYYFLYTSNVMGLWAGLWYSVRGWYCYYCLRRRNIRHSCVNTIFINFFLVGFVHFFFNTRTIIISRVLKHTRHTSYHYTHTLSKPVQFSAYVQKVRDIGAYITADVFIVFMTKHAGHLY